MQHEDQLDFFMEIFLGKEAAAQPILGSDHFS